uniref:Putative secreted peptide n=1 Tax=Anopheles braziliensis TaxID=58242 RepID=A0A2M3ZNF7_9DIPT
MNFSPSCSAFGTSMTPSLTAVGLFVASALAAAPVALLPTFVWPAFWDETKGEAALRGEQDCGDTDCCLVPSVAAAVGDVHVAVNREAILKDYAKDSLRGVVVVEVGLQFHSLTNTLLGPRVLDTTPIHRDKDISRTSHTHTPAHKRTHTLTLIDYRQPAPLLRFN